MTVGRSGRTPFKHWLLNAELGRLCGIFARTPDKVPAIANPFLVVDLCAGDGYSGDGGKSSPQIICHHLGIASRLNVDVHAVFIERASKTFSLLRHHVYKRDWTSFLNIDAREWVPPPVSPRQAVFIHSDPNTISDWPITHRLLDGMSDTTTLLATLGCNVGGLKMKPREERVQWYEHVRMITDDMPHYHDAILIALDRDAARWAYLIRLPKKWTDRTIENINTVGRTFSAFDLRIASFRQSFDEFESLQHYLFLTKVECAQ